MEITKEKLQKMYETMTIYEMCVALKISQPTVYKLLHSSGINVKRPRNKVIVIDSEEIEERG